MSLIIGGDADKQHELDKKRAWMQMLELVDEINDRNDFLREVLAMIQMGADHGAIVDGIVVYCMKNNISTGVVTRYDLGPQPEQHPKELSA